MRRVILVEIADILPPDEDVLLRLEMPRGTPVSPRLRAVMEEAAERMRSAAEPRGVLQEVPADDLAAMVRGDGRNADATPLETIVPRAEAFALFVGTLGKSVTEEIDECFREGDPSLAMLLDAYASEAANRLAYVLAAEFLGGLRNEQRATDAMRVLPYSPGYCGWHVSGQRALFEIIQAGDIGVTINQSCLMIPIKSVSGVMVAGDAAAHRFRPTYAFCDECSTHECVQRMMSVRR